MNIVKVTEGNYIDYSVSKNKITFNDELMINVAKYERDFPVTVDVCIDKYGSVTTGLGLKYAAQVEIPARGYNEVTVANPDYNPEDETSQETITTREPVAFSMDNVTMKLYAI